MSDDRRIDEEASDPVDGAVQQAASQQQREQRTAKFWRRFWFGVLFFPLLLPVLGYGCLRVSHWGAGIENLQVSLETTYLTEPLDDDGYVDYVAGMNEHLQSGFSLEENAAPLIWQALGPEEIRDDELREVIVNELKVDPFDDSPYYFTSVHRFCREVRPDLDPSDAAWPVGDDEEQLNSLFQATFAEQKWAALHALIRGYPQQCFSSTDNADHLWGPYFATQAYPWTRDTYPFAAAWLDHNEPYFELLSRAARRGHFYTPMVDGTEISQLSAVSLLHLYIMKEAMRAIASRAMLRIGESDAAGAWEDIVTLHGLARHLAADPYQTARIDAMEWKVFAYNIEEALLCAQIADETQLEAIAEQHAKIPPLPPLTDVVNVGERYFVLDCLCNAARYGGAAQALEYDDMISAADIDDDRPVQDWWINRRVNWNNVLRETNDRFDRAAAAITLPDYHQRYQACESLIAELNKKQQDAADDATLSHLSGRAAERRIIAVYLSKLQPDYRRLVRWDQNCQVRHRLTAVAIAVERFRLTNHEYPAGLDELGPPYFEVLPADGFTGGAVRYHRTGLGRLLYSVGHDQMDEGGEDPRTAGLFRTAGGDDVVFTNPPTLKFLDDEGLP